MLEPSKPETIPETVVKSKRGGARPGAGRPPSVIVHSRRQAHRMTVRNEQIASIIKSQVEAAENGDLVAAKFIIDGLFGKETPASARLYSINTET